MYPVGSEPPPWEVLRALTGHFDPCTLFTFIADSRAIQGWQHELKLCGNLIFLNLSHCGLCTLNALSNLTRLKYLDISHNNIVRLDQIHKLKSLETLKASANQVRRFQAVCGQQDFRDLAGLSFLTALYLQKPGGREACPVCHLPDYKSRVLSLLPRENCSKDSGTSPEECCSSRLSGNQQGDQDKRDGCSSDSTSLKQQHVSTGNTSLFSSHPLQFLLTGGPPARPTRLRVLDGVRLSLPDWNAQADEIQRHARQREETISRLRASVAGICQEQAILSQNREDHSEEFPQYQQKIAALQVALATARKTLEAFQEVNELYQ